MLLAFDYRGWIPELLSAQAVLFLVYASYCLVRCRRWNMVAFLGLVFVSLIFASLFAVPAMTHVRTQDAFRGGYAIDEVAAAELALVLGLGCYALFIATRSLRLVIRVAVATAIICAIPLFIEIRNSDRMPHAFWMICALSAIWHTITFTGLWKWSAAARLMVFDGRCGSCGYDLRGLVGDRCPECGREFEGAVASAGAE